MKKLSKKTKNFDGNTSTNRRDTDSAGQFDYVSFGIYIQKRRSREGYVHTTARERRIESVATHRFTLDVHSFD